MTALNQALEDIYTSLKNENQELDARILALKTAMQAHGAAAVEVDPARLPQPNRQGKKMLQSYFKQRGVVVNFTEQK
ncbi:MAG: hypothetical protein K2Q01_09375 [Rickettsiales bacterium]|nr:hypothetical protein [Rickettsiales bacterium]